MNRSSLAALAVTTLLASACGGSASDGSSSGTASQPSAQTIVVATEPAETELRPGATVQFVAQVTGTASTAVTWSVEEADGGTVDASGRYTAPATEGTYHVTAELNATASTTGANLLQVQASSAAKKKSTSVVHVSRTASSVAVSVNPSGTTVAAGSSAAFAATVTGTTNVAVTWSVAEGASCGTVNASGLYSAPTTGATCHVVATSQADTTRSATATVTVTAPAPSIAVSISPTTATVDACKGQVFTATVSNASNGSVTWSVLEAGGGTVTNGIYSAPQAAGTYHVVATSVADPTKSVQAAVTVAAERVLSVAVAPGSGAVQANGQLAFAATVTTTCGTFAAQ